MKKILLLSVFSLLSAISSVLGQPPASQEMTNIPPAIVQGVWQCVPVACAYVASWQRARKDGWIFSDHDSTQNLGYQMNPMFNSILAHLPGTRWEYGASPSVILRHIADQGAIDMAAMPYISSDTLTIPSLKLRYQALKNRAGKVEEAYTYFTDVAEEWLQTSPITGTFSTSANNAHTVMTYGYDQNHDNGNGTSGAWQIENSVGPSWGQNGCGWSPFGGYNHMWYFARLESKDFPLPEFVIQMKSNLYQKKLSKVPDSCMELKFSFTNGTDTLKNLYFRLWPVAGDYLFPLDTVAQIDGATGLIVSCAYKVWRYNETSQPAQMEIDSLADVKADGSKTSLVFTSERVDAILDSVQVNSTLINRLFYSKIVAKTTIRTNNIVEKTSANNFRCFPNPIATQAMLSFDNPKNGHVNLVVYDLNGRLVQNIWNGNLSAGEQKISWANNLPAGMYIIKKISFNGLTATQKVVIR